MTFLGSFLATPADHVRTLSVAASFSNAFHFASCRVRPCFGTTWNNAAQRGVIANLPGSLPVTRGDLGGM